MWEFKILGVSIYHITAWLFLYSFLGWAWESCYVSIKNKKLVNRGFVTGPFCTIYGVGAVSVYLILQPLAGKWLLLFLGGSLTATVLEYVTAVIMERLFHTSWWDYSNNKFNFQGRICLGSSIGWGFLSILMFWVLQPFVEWIVSLVSEGVGQVIIIGVTVIYVVDFAFSMAAALQLGKKLEQMERTMAELSEYFQKTKIYISTEEFIEKLEPYRLSFNKENVKEKMEQYQEAVMKRLEKLELVEYKEVVSSKVKQLSEKYRIFISKGGWNSRRFLRSYPHLSKASIRRRSEKTVPIKKEKTRRHFSLKAMQNRRKRRKEK